MTEKDEALSLQNLELPAAIESVLRAGSCISVVSIATATQNAEDQSGSQLLGSCISVLSYAGGRIK